VSDKYDAYVFEGRFAPWTKTNWRRVSAVLEPLFGGSSKTRVRVGTQKLAWHEHAQWTTRATDFFQAEFRTRHAFLLLTNARASLGRSKDVRSYAVFAAQHPAAESMAHQLAAILDVRRASFRLTDDFRNVLFETRTDPKHGHLALPAAWKRVKT
jgi:hypothetical protein